MKKLATKLTPSIKKWIKETHGSELYDDEIEDCFFNYPNYDDFNGFKERKHTGQLSEGYTVVTESAFLAEFGNDKPKRGDVVLVRDFDYKDWVERIFLTEIEGSKFPYICVFCEEENYKNGEKFNTCGFKQMKIIETITKEQAEKILKKRII